MTDYNDGKWHGWNGGECPVHPESVVEYLMVAGSDTGKARHLSWHAGFDTSIAAFRVTSLYIEPEVYTGECYAYHFTSMAPTIVDRYMDKDTIRGKYTAKHVNGKIKSIIWESDE